MLNISGINAICENNFKTDVKRLKDIEESDK